MFFRTRYRNLSLEVLKAFQVSAEPRVQLLRTARTLAATLGADLCQILVRGSASDGFQLRAWAGPGVQGPVEPDLPLEQHLHRLAVSGVVHRWSSGKGGPPPFPRVQAEDLTSAVAVPILWRHRPVAIVVAGFADRSRVPPRMVREIQDLSASLAPLIRGSLSRLYQMRKNEAAGELLRVSEDLSLAGNVPSCFARIARAAATLTGSSGSMLRMEESSILKVKAFFASGMPGIKAIGVPNDFPFAERALRSGRSVVIDHLHRETGENGAPVRRNLLCVPFTDGSSRGVLTLFDRDDGHGASPYSRLERETARALLRVGIMSLRHIGNETEVLKISRSLEWRVRELTLLHQISRVALDHSDPEEVLRSILEAVTNVVGFGFHRAFLFMHNIGKSVLKGAMGVEALPVSGINAQTSSPADSFGIIHQNIDEVVSGLEIAVKPGGGVLSRAVLERKSFRMRIPGDHNLLGSDVITQLGNVQGFAVAPLLSDEAVLGVIWVDNYRTMRPIRLDDFRLLVTAAAQAALAMERSSRAQAVDLLSSKLLDLQNQLIQWEKMAALGEMAASVAHDIRNPLVSIGGFARRLKRQLSGDHKGSRYAEVIIQEVDRLERTLENVMSYTRTYGMTERKPSRLYALLSECAELFSENFRKKQVVLKRQFERDIPEILLDERQIKQAVINILFNAGEAVPEGSEVRLSARVGKTEQGDFIVIDISDEGQGITDGDLKKVFQPFFTTKASGTGLGLAIAQRAVSGHGGEIRVDNRCGEGVTFSIYLPLAPWTPAEE